MRCVKPLKWITLVSFIERHAACETVKPATFDTKWHAVGCYSII
jgi:hypothetical protein